MELLMPYRFGNERNVRCRRYAECLDREVRRKSPGWNCAACSLRNEEADIPETEIEGAIILLWAVFKPGLYRKIKEAEKMFLDRWCLNGIDAISKFCDVDMMRIMKWIQEMGFPAEKQHGIWVARQQAVQKWMDEHRADIEEADIEEIELFESIIQRRKHHERRASKKRW